MTVVLNFYWRVDTQCHQDFFSLAMGTMNDQGDVLPRLGTGAETGEVEHFTAVELERLSAHAYFELTGQDSHTDEIAAVYALEALRNYCADPKESRALRRPVARTARAIFLPGEDYEGGASRLILHSCIIDTQLFAAWLKSRDAAFSAREHEVLDAHVGERPPGHHAIIPAARAVTVKIRDRHALLL